MSISAPKLEPLASDVEVRHGKLHVTLVDGRELSVPLDWFPRLNNASPTQRKQWELIGGGIGIHWPLLDEDISVENLLAPRATRRQHK
jgi:hypothetical protein